MLRLKTMFIAYVVMVTDSGPTSAGVHVNQENTCAFSHACSDDNAGLQGSWIGCV